MAVQPDTGTPGPAHWCRKMQDPAPRAVARQEDQVRDVVAQFGQPLRGRSGVVDLVDAFTNPIPNTVISRISGIPPYPGDEDRFRQIAQERPLRLVQ